MGRREAEGGRQNRDKIGVSNLDFARVPLVWSSTPRNQTMSKLEPLRPGLCDIDQFYRPQ